MTRGAFHRQGPFVESGGLSSPVPRPPRRLSASVVTAERRSRATLGLVRSCAVHSATARSTSIVSHGPDADVSPPTLAPARPPFTLTATLFGALRASLFEARMLLIDFCNTTYDVRTPTGALVSSQGRWPRPPSLSNASRGLPCESGDARRAALRPSDQTPVPVPPAFTGLPDRDT